MFRRLVSFGLTATAIILTASICLTAPVHAAAINDAFGDSVAAGLGLAPLANPTTDDTNCGRSSQSYSALAANQSAVTNQNFACSGNITDYVYARITNAVQRPRPQYATLTIGGNDVHYFDRVNDCMSKANCGGSATQQQFNNDLATLNQKLPKLISSINSQLAPGQILVTGYYNLFGSDVSCGAPYGITASEAATINGWTASINTAIQNAVKTVPSATYVPVSFNGDGICTSNGPIQTPSDPAWGHPTAKGSQLIASAVLSKVR